MVRVGMIALALFAGLRRGEIFGLQWENADLENQVLHIRHSYSYYNGLKDPKSQAGIRSIPMAEPVYAVLHQLRSLLPGEPQGFVFLSVRGKPIQPQDAYTLWQPVMKAAGLVDASGRPKYSFHTLRHANVNLLIDQGLDAFRIKNLIGHGSIAVTLDIYGHLFPDDGTGRKAIEAAAMQFDGGGDGPVLTVSARQSRTRLLPAARQDGDMAPV